MAVPKPKRYKKSLHKINVSAIEFDKIHLIRDKRLSSRLGLSSYELSFLLGKHDFFVRDVENPLEKKRYNIDDTNYLLLIFEDRLASIMPAKTEQETYQLEITYYLNGVRLPVYEINIINTVMHPKIITGEGKHEELPTTLDLFSFTDVQLYVDELLCDNFFNGPKRALDIFAKCKLNFGKNFHPRNMIKVLNYYTNKKSGIPKLDKVETNEFGRRLFVKVADI